MSMPRNALRQDRFHGPVTGFLLLALYAAPAIALAAVGASAAFGGKAAPRSAMIAKAPEKKPLQARLPTEAPKPAPASEQFALAFGPPERVARAAAPADDMPVASTSAGPAPRANQPATFKTVRIGERLQLVGDGHAIALAGIKPLADDAMCRRLDGVLETCGQRAAARLEVLTRGRIVTCDMMGGVKAGPPRGTCRAGKIDLADDLVKNRLARRA